MPSATARSRVARGWVFGLGTVLVAVVLLECASYLAIGLANAVLTQPIITRGAFFEGQSTRIRALLESARRDQLDPLLGWRYRAGYTGPGDTLNQGGMRASREYSTNPSDSVPRVAAFGDSYVYCTEVSNEECWTSELEAGWNVEVLNYGVGGYGTDQAFLRYLREGDSYQPERVLIGFAPVDLARSVSRYRRFFSSLEGPWFKPRFRLVDGELELIPSPITTEAQLRELLDDPTRVLPFGDGDYFYEPAIYEHRLYRWSATYRLLTNSWARLRRSRFDPNRHFRGGTFRTESEAFALQTETMIAFADSVTARGATPVFLFFPNQTDVAGRARGEGPTYDPLWSRLESEGVQMIDPLDALVDADASGESLFAPGGHYSAEGNRIVANVVAERLALAMR